MTKRERLQQLDQELYLGAVDGRLIVGVAADVSGEIGQA